MSEKTERDAMSLRVGMDIESMDVEITLEEILEQQTGYLSMYGVDPDKVRKYVMSGGRFKKNVRERASDLLWKETDFIVSDAIYDYMFKLVEDAAYEKYEQR